MILHGIPDFSQPLLGDGFRIFYPFENRGGSVLVPDNLEVAERKGQPDFRVHFIRGENPLLPPAPYGALDFSFRPQDRSTDALALLRAHHPQGMIAPASFEQGYACLVPIGEAAGFPDELRQAVPLRQKGAGELRFIKKNISPSGIAFIKGALQNELLLFYAIAVLELYGYSPRLPVRLRFDPAELVTALSMLADENGYIAYESVRDFFLEDSATLPLHIIGELTDEQHVEFAEALTDRLRNHARLCASVLPPGEEPRPYLALRAASEVGSGQFEWDLSQPVQVLRPFTFFLNPVAATRKLVEEQGLDAFYRETIVAPIPTGYHSIDIQATLPNHRPNVPVTGVRIKAPPKPPFRMQASAKTVKLVPPEDTGNVRLKLAPREPLEYTYTPYMIARFDGRARHLRGETQAHSGDSLELEMDDFPVDFIPIAATTALLELAKLHGTCAWTADGSTQELEFELNRDQPETMLALPKGTENATLEIEARQRTGGHSLVLGPFPAAATTLGLYSLPEFGPHTIEIDCAFDDGQNFYAIELLPEDRDASTAELAVMHFTPGNAKKQWSYFAESPFKAGYRFRPQRRRGETPAAWSELQSPFATLQIQAKAEQAQPDVELPG